ncbi:unnamed protein product, partial [Strongylus vulgaris]
DLRIYSSSSPPADGIAIWYVDEPQSGPAWGGPTNFSGIAIVLDTYTNAIDSSSVRQSTRLFAVIRNRSFANVLDPSTDGSNLRIDIDCDLGNEIAFNRIPLSYDHVPSIRILVRYEHERLGVYYTLPFRNQEQWQHCLNVSGQFFFYKFTLWRRFIVILIVAIFPRKRLCGSCRAVGFFMLS